MDTSTVFLLLCLASFCSALELGIYGEASRILKEGEEMTLTCHLDQGLAVILSHNIYWEHKPLFDPTSQVMVLTEQQTLMNKNDSNYDVKVKDLPGATNVTLTIKKGAPSLDGLYTCRAVPNEGGEDLSAEVDVIVPSNITFLELMFDGEQVSDVNDVPGEREEGQFGVTCVAKGFNPEARVQLFLGDEELDIASHIIMLDTAAGKTTNARRFKATMSVKNLQLTASNSGEVLKCQARATFEGAEEHVASMPLEIIALAPEITCEQNASARVGERYIKIKCLVNHARVKVAQYNFEIGDTGEVIDVDTSSKNHDTMNVEPVEGMENTTDTVTLTLYQVDDDHFDTYYYLNVYLEDGTKFHEKAALVKLHSSNGSSMSACYLSLLLSLFLFSL